MKERYGSVRSMGVLTARLMILACLAAGAVQAQAPQSQGPLSPPALSQAPEASSGRIAQQGARARRMMVATANPHASRAALQILREGGSATDAAIAAQMVLTLTEPQSSGIGGGAFLMHYSPVGRTVQAWDGRETAPSGATERLFLDAQGKPLAFFDAVVGGRSVGVPGVVRMLEAAHAEHGRLPWARLFEPAILLASQGFEVSPRLHRLITIDRHLRKDPAAAAYFYDRQGQPWPVGHLLRNPALADTLGQIAKRGSLALHSGPIAHDIVEAVQRHPSNPGVLTERDLAFYKPVVRDALCTPLQTPRANYRICGMPPPSSGAIAVAQILGILQAAGAPRLADAQGELQADGLHVFTEAGRLAFADRNQYVADPDHVDVPAGLTDAAYLRERAQQVGERSMKTATAGQPERGRPARQATLPPMNLEQPATSHLSIVDARGNAVSMTTTIEDAFGARLMVRGFLLNNQLTDFSFAPRNAATDGKPPTAVANRVEPDKRPRSSMAPTLVLDEHGQLMMAVGSPGGSQIISYVARTLWLTLHDGLGIQQAISLPNFGSRNGPTELETGMALEVQQQALLARGHEVRRIEMTSGLQGIVRRCALRQGCWLEGGADPRREGLVIGD